MLPLLPTELWRELLLPMGLYMAPSLNTTVILDIGKINNLIILSLPRLPIFVLRNSILIYYF